MPQLTTKIKSFFVKTLATKRNIFSKCSTSWLQYWFFLLDALPGIDVQLDRHTILTISTNNLSEVAQAMDNVIIVEVRVDWLNGILQRIHEDREL